MGDYVTVLIILCLLVMPSVEGMLYYRLEYLVILHGTLVIYLVPALYHFVNVESLQSI